MEVEIGEVEHFFGHIPAAVFKVIKEGLAVGDTLHFKGHTTDFQQTIESMQVEHQDVKEAKAGDSIGLKVKERVRIGDKVYKVTI